MKEVYCSQNVCQKREGHFITMETHSSQLEKIYLWTEYFYNNIRKTNMDTVFMFKHSNIPENILETIKKHIFLEEHLFDHEIQRFTIDEDIAAAWHRLYQNTFTKSDLILLQQAYAEAVIMNGAKVRYKEAYSVVKKSYDWNSSF